MPQPMLLADCGDQLVEHGGAGEIDGLGGLVQHQEMRIARQRPRQATRWNSPPESCAICASIKWVAPVSARHSSARALEMGAVSDMKRRTLSGMIQSAAKRCGT